MATTGLSQAPFERTGQVFLSLPNTNELVKMRVNPSNFVPDLIGNLLLPSIALDAIGFRKTDNLIYGVNQYNNHLIAVGADGIYQDFGASTLNNAMYYLAGDVSPDGKELVSIGSNGNTDVHLAKTNLQNGSYTTEFVQMTGGSFMADIAFDPYTGELYGYDQANKNIVKINIGSGAITILHQIENSNGIIGLYFDAFGDLHAYGTAVSNLVEAVFNIDKATGKEKMISTGPVSLPNDAASCPFSIEMRAAFVPQQTLPCTEVILNYTLANGSGSPQAGIDFTHKLPQGTNFQLVLANPFGVAVDTSGIPGTVRMSGLTLPPGNKNISFKIKVNDIPKGNYRSQPYLDNLPSAYGLVSLADNPATAGFEDSTILRVNRFDEDSLFNEYLLCHGESLVLDASEYGASFIWNDGSTNSQYTVSQTGIYTIDVGSACEHLTVRHVVTATSCPFTVSLYQLIEPDSLYGCHNSRIKFIVKNDSGEKRPHVTVSETLPTGFSFIEVLRNPFGGNLKQGLPDNMFSFENMTLEVGTDTIELLVRIGEVTPGKYRFMGTLSGLPQLMGPLRYSDDPTTLLVDSTSVQVLGNLEDTLRFDTFICLKQRLLLDARSFGETFIWDDGSTFPQHQVTQPGIYHAIQLDGCHPQELFWNVAAANSVTVDSMDLISIHQGEKIELRPIILNQEDSLLISWTDPLGNSLSCYDCIRPVSTALKNTEYTILVSNTVCADSTNIKILVDDTRRIYAPNVFSPNDDGINDYFFLQSPDFGKILNFQITGRWGNQVFRTGNIGLNEPALGWDGYVMGKGAQPGTYLWEALIEFIDGKKETFAGDFTLIR